MLRLENRIGTSSALVPIHSENPLVNPLSRLFIAAYLHKGLQAYQQLPQLRETLGESGLREIKGFGEMLQQFIDSPQDFDIATVNNENERGFCLRQRKSPDTQQRVVMVTYGLSYYRRRAQERIGVDFGIVEERRGRPHVKSVLPALIARGKLGEEIEMTPWNEVIFTDRNHVIGRKVGFPTVLNGREFTALRNFTESTYKSLEAA